VVRLLQFFPWRCHELRVFNISAMRGDGERGWWVVWGQSAVPASAGTIFVDSAPEALPSLSDYGLRKSSGSFAIFAAIRRAYAIPNFFDTCAEV
jgi:hypothetical protein